MALDFQLTPDEAQTLAESVHKSGFFQGRRVLLEQPIDRDAPMRTTFLAAGVGPVQLVEVQKAPRYEGPTRLLAQWLAAHRMYTQLYIATSHLDNVSLAEMAQLKRDGTGLLVIGESGNVDVVLEAVCPALTVTPEPTLKLGKCNAEIAKLVQRFNSGERKAAFQEMCEVVERETRNLLGRAVKTGRVTTDANGASRADWSQQINLLSSPKQAAAGTSPVIAEAFKNDLHSFRGARNKVDHAPKNAKEAVKRDQQLTERMMMGPRLVDELLRLRRSLK